MDYNSASSAGKPASQKNKLIPNNTDSVLFGKHSAKGTTCFEFAINNLVARVQLERLDRSGLGNKRKFIQMVPTNKPIKRRLPMLTEKNAKRSRLNSKIVEKPRKIAINNRPLKNNTLISQTKPNNISNNKSVLNRAKMKLSEHPKPRLKQKHHFNGDKHPVIFSGPRVRKPNPKFQDYIISPQVRSITEKPPKEKSETPVVKQKPKPVKSSPVKSNPVKSNPLITNPVKAQEEDPLDLMGAVTCNEPTDDVVRSFLPVIEKPDAHSESESDLEENSINTNKFYSKNKVEELTLPTVQSNEKENQIERVSCLKNVRKSNANLLLKTSNQKQLTPNSSLILAPHSVTPVLISPKLVNASSIPIIIATNFIPPLAKDVTLPVIQSIKAKETNTTKSNAIHNTSNEEKVNNEQKKDTPVTNKKRGRKKNMSSEVAKKKNNVRYYLVESEGALNKSKNSKATEVDFSRLVRTLKSVKLPAPNWKIRIVVSRQQTITEVTFTNKEVNERCVKFSRIFTGYVITFGRSVVQLIGAPSKISSFSDVTILLNIIHNLSLNDPILQYISDKDK